MQTAAARQNFRMSSGGIFPAYARRKSRRNARFSSVSATSAPTYTETSCIKDSVRIDPCMGSGHILVYAFDVLMQIYLSQGYSERDAVCSILKNNLYGLDIDKRAAQLAYFAVMMKARQYDRRIFSRGIMPNVFAITESNGLSQDAIYEFVKGDPKLKHDLDSIISDLHDAKEYGSILTISPVDFDRLYARLDELMGGFTLYYQDYQTHLLPLLKTAELLSMKYDVVVTNPPYMGSSNMDAKLSDFVKANYPDSKSDMFAVFIERCGEMVKPNGYQAMITQHAWMFLSSFENLRVKLLHRDTTSMVHLGARAFEDIGGEVVQTTAFVMRNSHIPNYAGTYCRLIEPTTQQGKEDLFLTGTNRYIANQSNFSKIPGSPVAYWVSEAIHEAYDNPLISTIAFSDGQILTGNNDKYLRLLWEVNKLDIDSGRWMLHAKGGEQRRWYGNLDTVVDWSKEAIEHYKADKISRFPKDYVLFREGITWSLISSSDLFSMRYLTPDTTFNKAAATILFDDNSLIMYTLGFLNSAVARCILKVVNPTLNTNIKDILGLPFKLDSERRPIVENAVQNNISISRTEWDAFETSWDFIRHPLVRSVSSVSDAFIAWQNECSERFAQLKANEEELNRIFIDIYGLQDELSPEVEDKDVTVRLADKGRDVRSLISYAVGCMFGRYSLDCEGLAYAGGEWDESKYTTFTPDKENIIPICDDDYFDDDITGRFVKWVETVYGKETLEENLRFIAEALGGKGSPREVIRNYFLNDFYQDHLKIYQKRPIYWLFDSGKKNGFKALVYMHRYKSDLLARMRTDYVHEQQERYRTQLAHIADSMETATQAEKVRLSKQEKKLREQALEIGKFEEKIHHLADMNIEIDLDDGVKTNYQKFGDVLGKIK